MNTFFNDTGITKILHDTMALTEVNHCEEPGCDVHPVSYQASENQMKALIAVSSQCSQSIIVSIYI
jgi:contactin associated protein 1